MDSAAQAMLLSTAQQQGHQNGIPQRASILKDRMGNWSLISDQSPVHGSMGFGREMPNQPSPQLLFDRLDQPLKESIHDATLPFAQAKMGRQKQIRHHDLETLARRCVQQARR